MPWVMVTNTPDFIVVCQVDRTLGGEKLGRLIYGLVVEDFCHIEFRNMGQLILTMYLSLHDQIQSSNSSRDMLHHLVHHSSKTSFFILGYQNIFLWSWYIFVAPRCMLNFPWCVSSKIKFLNFISLDKYSTMKSQNVVLIHANLFSFLFLLNYFITYLSHMDLSL